MIQFYNVKKKSKVDIPKDQVERKEYKRTLKSGKESVRYAFAAIDEDGTKLTKFCSKKDYDSLA